MDRQAVQQVRSGAKDITQALEGVRDKAEDVERRMDEVRNWAGYFGDLATSALFFGAALSGPILLSIHNFVQAQGRSEETSRQWLRATDDLQRSYLRLGRIGAQAALPALELAADIAERVAGFAERNPEAVRNLLFTGVGLVGLAAVGEAVERGIRIYTDAKSLFFTSQQVLAGRLMEQAANKQVAAATAMVTGSRIQGAGGAAQAAGGLARGGLRGAALLAGSVAGGALVGGAVANRVTGDEDFAGRTLRQALTLPSAAASSALLPLFESIGVISPETADSLGDSFGQIYGAFGNEGVMAGLREVGEFVGVLAEEGEAAGDGAKEAQEEFLNREAAFEAFIQFQTEAQQAERDAAQRRGEIVQEQGTRLVELEAQFAENRANQVERFLEQQAAAQRDYDHREARQQRDYDRETERQIADHEDERRRILDEGRERESSEEDAYYERRTDLAKQFGEEAEKAEAEHQKRMRRGREDHALRLEDAIRAQDAGAFLREQRDYEINRRRAAEDFGEQQGQRSEQQAEQLREMETEFQEQREARQVERETRLQELEDQFAQEQEQRQADFDLRLADQLEDFDELRTQRQAEHEKSLAEFDQNAAETLEKQRSADQEQLNQFDSTVRQEAAIREKAYADQLRQLDAHYLNETALQEQWLAEQERQFEASLQDLQRRRVGSNLPGFPSRQSGGYVGGGLYDLHPGEFVLSPGATQSAERLLGGRLTQDALLAALASRGGVGGGQFTQNNHFSNRDDGQMIVDTIMRRTQAMQMKLERGI